MGKKTRKKNLPTAGYESSNSWSKMQTQSLLRRPREADISGGTVISDMSSEDDTERINVGEEEVLELRGYRSSKHRVVASWIGIVLSCGLLRLFFHWFPRLHLYATHIACPLSVATKVLVVETFQKKCKNYYVKNIKTTVLHGLSTGKEDALNIDGANDHRDLKKNNERKIKFYLSNGEEKEAESIRHFSCKKECYIWDEDSEQFLKISGLEVASKNMDFHRHNGLTEQEQSLRQIAYGPNEIMIPIENIAKLLVLEVLNPFYVFQAFSLAIWFSAQYYYYAVAIIIMSVFGVTTSIIQTRRNQKQLKRTVTSADIVTVIRRVEGEDGESEVKEEILAKNLVPGDVIALPPHGCIMSCDAVLLSGNAIVNESMLTGESVPVTKIPIPYDDRNFNEKDDNTKHSVLFCGTKVLQTRFYGDQWARAVVLRTGFLTSKGQIVKTILYPPPVDFLFERDSYKFIGILSVIAVVGFIYTIITKAIRGKDLSDIAIKALDLITIAVPPALPAAMTVGKMYAQSRLKEKGIFCINSRVINVTGSIDCVCYDKTGTLTEEGLDMWGIIPVNNREMQSPVRDFPLSQENSQQKYNMLLEHEQFVVAMATCHALTYLGGSIIGDPLDLKMFESTGWVLEEPEMSETSQFDLLVPMVVRPSGHEVRSEEGQIYPFEEGIIRQFHFSSSLQRMSVITRRLGSKNFSIYCKGSPEMIMSLSRPETIPEGISTTLEMYTKKGYRVLAIGWKSLPPETTVVQVHRLKREQVELDFIFLGLILFENRLKKSTQPIVAKLNRARIRQIMITGDNILTAISVAHDCGLVSSQQKVYQLLPPTSEEINCMGNVNSSWTAKNIFKEEDILELKSPNREEQIDNFLGSINEEDDIDLEKGISHLKTTYAVSGPIWAELKKSNPDLLRVIVKYGTIFARMSPTQKQQLVQELQGIGHCVAMCGDGANDCGALKAAHAGISLSEAESSAASPFTSNGDDISCVPQVIAEGRAALVTSSGIFKFMATYSLVQFASVILLYTIDSNLTDFEFLYIDLCLVTLFAALWGLAGPPDSSKGLAPTPPSASLFSPFPIASIISQVVIMMIFQYFAYFSIRLFPWFTPFTHGEQFLGMDSDYACYENYGVFSISSFQYIWMAIAFSRGAPHRKSLLSNKKLLFSLVLMGLINLIIVITPPSFLSDLLELIMPPPLGDRFLIIPIAILNFFISLSIEWGLMENILKQRKARILWIKKRDKAIAKYQNSKSLKPLVSTAVSPKRLDTGNEANQNSDNPTTTITHL